ncbi:MAG: DEAD/DEAH box helicase [Nitriliruptoraceae bacterium]
MSTDPRDVLELIERSDASGVVHTQPIAARQPVEVPLPADVPEVVRGRLQLQGITTLWSHQATVRTLAHAGTNVILATGTASGKSLAYQLPIIERTVADPQAVTVYIAPTKALAYDQLRQIRGYKLPQIRAAVIDGDTPAAEREAIRRTANVILTNPDLLHHAVLGQHRAWANVLHRLAFVVVDEAHVARGVFGSHVALVLARLKRAAQRYSATPTWLLASATIGNPAEHATRLVGSDVVAVTNDGSPRGPLRLALWQVPRDDDGRAVHSVTREAGMMLAEFVAAGIQTLVFASSRRGAEAIALIAKERLDGQRDDGLLLSEMIAAYRAGLLPQERRSVEAGLRDGTLRGVAATEALELGIDISGLDAVILAGWPGTSAAFWQRVGRAGRRAGAAAAVFIGQEDPLDQYLLNHPRELLERPAEDAIIDPSNRYILRGHLHCACYEFPMTAAEAADTFGGKAPAALAVGVTDNVLRLRSDKHYWTSRERPSAAVDLRSSGGATVRIVDSATGAIIGDVDEPRAHQQVHTGAHYVHQGRALTVQQLDLGQRVALVEDRTDTATTTRPRSDTNISIDTVTLRHEHDGFALSYGSVDVTTRVTGYDVIRIGANDVVDRCALELPDIRLSTMAVWYELTDDDLECGGVTPPVLPGALHAAEHAAIGVLGLIAMCDRWDIGGLSTPRHAQTAQPTVFIYDGYPGGAGLAERSFQRFGEHIALTHTTIGDCPCHHGCPSCIQSPKCGNGNDPLDKSGALRVLELVRSHAHELPGFHRAATTT